MSNQHNRPALVVFQGKAPASASLLEKFVYEAMQSATLDLLQRAEQSAAFESAILVTEDPALRAVALDEAQDGDLPLSVEPALPGLFNFGETLYSVCEQHGLERVVYAGGGALALATVEELRDLALSVSGTGECVTSNNLFSADVVAFWPASALERITLPFTDNDLAWLLHFRAGLPYAPRPRTLGMQFDIDTPIDPAVLWWASQSAPFNEAVGSHMAEMVARVPALMPVLADKMQAAYRVMSTRRAQVLIAGRVSSWTWRRLEANLPCQTRVVSEERGMRASGREERGEARSLLGLYTDLAGISGLISAFEQTCNAAFLDTRVLFAHRGLHPSANDRFASDALLPQLITDPWVRELTETAINAKIPILLGGHSLVAGGIWALSERVRASASAASG